MAHPIPATRKNNWKRRPNYHETEFPVKYDGNGDAPNYVEEGDDNHGHVDTQKLLQLGRIGGNSRIKQP